MVDLDPQLLRRVVSDPKIMVGKPVVRGTRIQIEMIVRMVAQGTTTDEILADYPSLKPNDIQAALQFGEQVRDNFTVATGSRTYGGR
jgi:uncharacterized protein (DUF433 family)